MSRGVKKTGLVKHSLSIGGHQTSVSLEPPFLDELRSLASRQGRSLAALVAEVDSARPPSVNLSSALRLYVLATLKRGDEASWRSDSGR